WVFGDSFFRLVTSAATNAVATASEQRGIILCFQLGQALLDGLHVFGQLEDRLVNLLLGFLVRERRDGGMDAHQFTGKVVACFPDLFDGISFVHSHSFYAYSNT